MSIVHALGDDKQTCKACGGDWPCPGWVEQLDDLEPFARLDARETYRDVPKDVAERLEAALTKEEDMELIPIRKDPKSNSGDCPALYRVDSGGHVVVGKATKLDAAELAFGLGDDEVAVYVPPGVLAE